MTRPVAQWTARTIFAVQHAHGRPAAPDIPRAGGGTPHLCRCLQGIATGAGPFQGSAAIPRPPLPVPDQPFGACLPFQLAGLLRWPGSFPVR